VDVGCSSSPAGPIGRTAAHRLPMAAFATRISTLGGTVYHYFQAWRNTGMWVHLHRALYEQARRYAGRANP
jgi:hypothetical protein